MLNTILDFIQCGGESLTKAVDRLDWETLEESDDIEKTLKSFFKEFFMKIIKTFNKRLFVNKSCDVNVKKRYPNYFNALNKISTGCNAVFPVPSLIWCLQLVPGAAINTLDSAFRTAGNNTISPIFIDTS